MIETMLAGTVTVAEPTVLLEMDVAVMVTVISLGGGFGGALYVTDVPVAALSVPAPDAGEIAQVTLVCRGSYCTVAISPCVLPAGTSAVLGTTDTTLAGTVMVAETDVALPETAVAVMVTGRSLGGGVAGA